MYYEALEAFEVRLLPHFTRRSRASFEAWQVRMKDAVNEPHEVRARGLGFNFRSVTYWGRQGKRKNELTWKIHLIHWEKNRYIYNAYWVDSTMCAALTQRPSQTPCCRPCPRAGCDQCNAAPRSKPIYDYLIANKIADGDLIAKWKKPGYECVASRRQPLLLL